ncbi:MAG: hypothetical protein K0U37_00110 [Gammaproteobacteria bacterium]|nr:hypothetical protein [Gammaproteobacteria bacterium]
MRFFNANQAKRLMDVAVAGTALAFFPGMAYSNYKQEEKFIEKYKKTHPNAHIECEPMTIAGMGGASRITVKDEKDGEVIAHRP